MIDGVIDGYNDLVWVSRMFFGYGVVELGGDVSWM